MDTQELPIKSKINIKYILHYIKFRIAKVLLIFGLFTNSSLVVSLAIYISLFRINDIKCNKFSKNRCK